MNVTRYFFLVCLGILSLAQAQEIQLDFQEEGVLLTEGNDNILFYQSAEKALNGTYARANYVHPLYGLDGTVLTEDFPEDHLHHRGIFWAWHQLYVGDARIGDGWEIKDFSWEVKEVNAIESPGGGKGIRSRVHWESPLLLNRYGKKMPLVEETTEIIAYPAKDDFRAIDISISLLALHSNMRLGGSEDEKGYGGFSYRVRLPEDIKFSGVNGPVTPETLPVWSNGWLDATGSLGKDGNTAGLAILSHPQNPGYPNPWILRASASMQNAVYPHPGAVPVPLSEENPTVLRYRMVVHTGLPSEKIKTLFDAFGKE